MNALIGKIISTKPGARRRGLTRITVKFKAAARLPERADPPTWLADQVLTIARQVADVREVGGPGDAIALTAAESEKWLVPLVIDPSDIQDESPKTIRLTLRWWKSPTPPQFAVSGHGKNISGTFTRRSGVFTATIPTKALFDKSTPRPFDITATCDTLSAVCPVVSRIDPGYCRFLDLRGDGYRLLNRWYAVDLVGTNGGAIVGLRERARNVDHLASLPTTQKALDKAGHSDRVRIGNSDKLAEAKLAFTIRQREVDCTRIEIDGLIDESKNLHSAAAYRLLDALPILVLRRDARLGEPKPDEKKKEPTDFLVPLQVGFRHAFMVEGDGTWGTQVLAPDGDRLGIIRAMYEMDHAHRGDWMLKAGWAMVHHPLRRQATLFVFEQAHYPEMTSWSGGDFMTLEPYWLGRPYRPPAGTAFTLGLSAGEICGASLDAAWVACQAPAAQNRIQCAAIAKLREPRRELTAEFRLGRETRTAALEKMFIEGVGDVHFAVATFPAGKAMQPLDATVAGISARSKP